MTLVKQAYASGDLVTPPSLQYSVSWWVSYTYGPVYTYKPISCSATSIEGLKPCVTGAAGVSVVYSWYWGNYYGGSNPWGYTDVIASQMGCPAHAHPTGTTICTCDNPTATDPIDYVPDFTKTSCVTEQYTLSLATAGQVEPSKTATVIATVKDGQEQPKSGVAVSITVDVEAGTGGHGHHDDNRPKGSLSGGGATGSDGTVSFTFVAPEVSGTHTFTAQCESPTCTNNPVTAKIDVKVDGLAPIPGSSFYRPITPNADTNHSSNHYLTSDAASQLWQLAATYYFKYRQNTSVPLLHLNDASLVWGGKFDITGNWTGDHAGHRKGTVIDIRANALPTAIPESLFDDFEDMADQTESANGTSATAQLHHVGLPSQHYHVLLLGVDQ